MPPRRRMRRPALALLAAAQLALVFGLAPSGVSFDGMAFLLAAREGTPDYGHALYPLLLRLAGTGEGAILGARFLSALGGVLAAALLLRRLQRAGAPPLDALLVTGLVVLSTLLWQEAGSVEPTTWTLASLLGAGEAAEAYGRRSSAARLALVTLAFDAALGFHLVSACALPWLVRCARRAGARVRSAHVAVPVAAAAALLGLALLGGRLGASWTYWAGFLPDPAEGGAHLASSLSRGGRLLGEGAPTLLAALAAVAVLRPGPLAWREGAWLATPYLGAFLVLGKPLVGLLAPVLVAAGLLLGARLAAARSPGPRTACALALLAQLGLGGVQAAAWHRAPDQARVDAELLARALPSGTPLLAGDLALHLRYWHPALDVRSLPELVHRARAAGQVDPLEVVRALVRAEGRRCALSSDGVAFLYGLGADPEALGLRVESALWIPENPRLALFPLEP